MTTTTHSHKAWTDQGGHVKPTVTFGSTEKTGLEIVRRVGIAKVETCITLIKKSCSPRSLKS